MLIKNHRSSEGFCALLNYLLWINWTRPLIKFTLLISVRMDKEKHWKKQFRAFLPTKGGQQQLCPMPCGWCAWGSSKRSQGFLVRDERAPAPPPHQPALWRPEHAKETHTQTWEDLPQAPQRKHRPTCNLQQPGRQELLWWAREWCGVGERETECFIFSRKMSNWREEQQTEVYALVAILDHGDVWAWTAGGAHVWAHGSDVAAVSVEVHGSWYQQRQRD